MKSAKPSRKLDQDHFANVVIFLLMRCPTAGLTKLLKLLYLAESQHYRKYLTPLFGGSYIALKCGPVLDNYKHLFAVLEEKGIVKETTKKILGVAKPKTEYVPLREPNLAAFSQSELETLDKVVEFWGKYDGSTLSQYTHRAGPWTWIWDPSEPGRAIPYSTFRWLENLDLLTDADDAHAQAALKRLKASGVRRFLGRSELEMVGDGP